jgi:hypothetical protein
VARSGVKSAKQADGVSLWLLEHEKKWHRSPEGAEYEPDYVSFPPPSPSHPSNTNSIALFSRLCPDRQTETENMGIGKSGEKSVCPSAMNAAASRQVLTQRPNTVTQRWDCDVRRLQFNFLPPPRSS